jgi:hypothetical protein
MNHSLFCLSEIGKLNRPVKVLNLRSKSQTGSATLCLIHFSSVMHCDSELGFLNSALNVVLISFNGLGYIVPLTNFMYQLSARSLKVVLN